MKKIEIKVKGMHCVGCENTVKQAILDVNGVKDAKVDYTREKAAIEFDTTKTNIRNIKKAIVDAGFEI